MTAIASTAHILDRSDQRRRIWAIFGSSSGNLVEWYDFYAYAFTALYFAPSFFPNGNQTCVCRKLDSAILMVKAAKDSS
jgi:hypothetical protein